MGLFAKKKQGSMELPPPPPRKDDNINNEFELPELPPFPEEKPEKEENLFAELPPLPAVPSFNETAKERMPAKEFTIEAPAERQILTEKMPMKPLFVSVEDYKFILEGIDLVRKKILESQSAMDDLERLKTEEEKLLDEWKTRISDIEKKLEYIDRAVLKSEG